jgi:uncharacterized membrane protein
MTKLSVDRLERILGRVLGIGTAASTVCLAAGLVMTFAAGRNSAAAALLSAGIVVLLATPVVRVAVSSAGYARQRDWLFVGLTLVVLAELLSSIIAALAHELTG